MMVVEQLLDQTNLTDTEKSIAQYLMNKKNEIQNLTSSELGKLTYTSQAAVTRLYKKLGFKSYRSFMSSLVIERNEYFKYQSLSKKPGQFFTNLDDIEKVISNLYAKSIMNTNLYLDSNVITRVCNQLMSAKMIDVYGVGISDTIAKQMVFKLQALGMPATFHNGINQVYVKNQKASDHHVSVLITLTGHNETIYEIASTLKKKNIYTVCILGHHHQEMMNACHDCIMFNQTDFEDVDSMLSTFSAEYVVNVIYASLIYRIQL